MILIMEVFKFIFDYNYTNHPQFWSRLAWCVFLIIFFPIIFWVIERSFGNVLAKSRALGNKQKKALTSIVVHAFLQHPLGIVAVDLVCWIQLNLIEWNILRSGYMNDCRHKSGTCVISRPIGSVIFSVSQFSFGPSIPIFEDEQLNREVAGLFL